MKNKPIESNEVIELPLQLGNLVIKFSHLEFSVDITLWILIEPSKYKKRENAYGVAQIVTSRILFRDKVELLKSLCKHKKITVEDDTLFAELLRIGEERNRIMHSFGTMATLVTTV